MALSTEEQRRVITEFIELYKFEPCLWRIKSKEYHDRGKREAAYKKLLEKLKEIDHTTNKDAVVKKINNLRSNVRKEKKKYEDSIKSGASTDEVYHPKLWYYHLFDFLGDQETPRTSVSNLDPDEEDFSEIGSIQETQNSHVSDAPDSPSRQGPSTTDNAAGPLTENEDIPCSSRKSTTGTSKARPGKRNQDTLTNDVLTTVQEHFKRPHIQEDRFDIFGKSVAIKLREVDKRQSLIAEKLINDVIFEAELGNLTLQHTCLNMQETSDARIRNMQQYQPAMFSRHSISRPLSQSSSSSFIITPAQSPSSNSMQYNQSETAPLQPNPQYTFQHAQPQNQSETAQLQPNPQYTFQHSQSQNQSEITQLQPNPQYSFQHSQSQQFSPTSSAQHCSQFQENQQPSENVVLLESSKGHQSLHHFSRFFLGFARLFITNKRPRSANASSSFDAIIIELNKI